jgi:hypothetical protein
LLDNSAFGAGLTLQFSPSASTGNIPYLIINSIRYPLLRSWADTLPIPAGAQSSSFAPKPDGNYYFTNTAELRNATYATEYNWDVVPKDGGGNGSYAYAAFYMAAWGVDQHYNAIYSRPIFLGVLRLPD